MKKLLVLALISLSFMGCAHKMKRVSPGTTKDEIIGMYGKPYKTDSYEGRDMWYFYDEGFRSCQFVFNGDKTADKPLCTHTDQSRQLSSESAKRAQAALASMASSNNESSPKHTQTQTTCRKGFGNVQCNSSSNSY